jgi:membrane protein YqaA with SNARE-associated domain
MPDNAGGLVYGTILVATLLAAESARRDTYLDTVGAVLLALLTYWLTLTYAHYTGERLEHEEHFRYGAFARAAARELTLLYGSLVPLVGILVCWAAGAALGTAVNVAVASAAAAIIAAEIVIGVRADLERGELVRQTVVGALLGLLVISLRLLLH